VSRGPAVAGSRPACGRLQVTDDARPRRAAAALLAARGTLTGAGAVVDGGAFLGGSTIALTRGLEASDRDRAQWQRVVKW
jgi:hypothetical protein